MYLINDEFILQKAMELNCDELLLKSFCIVVNTLEYNNPGELKKKNDVDRAITNCYGYLCIEREPQFEGVSLKGLITAINNMKEFRGRYGATTSISDLLASLLKELHYSL